MSKGRKKKHAREAPRIISGATREEGRLLSLKKTRVRIERSQKEPLGHRSGAHRRAGRSTRGREGKKRGGFGLEADAAAAAEEDGCGHHRASLCPSFHRASTLLRTEAPEQRLRIAQWRLRNDDGSVAINQGRTRRAAAARHEVDRRLKR